MPETKYLSMKDEMKIYPNLARLSKIKLKNYDKLEYFIREKERERIDEEEEEMNEGNLQAWEKEE